MREAQQGRHVSTEEAVRLFAQSGEAFCRCALSESDLDVIRRFCEAAPGKLRWLGDEEPVARSSPVLIDGSSELRILDREVWGSPRALLLVIEAREPVDGDRRSGHLEVLEGGGVVVPWSTEIWMARTPAELLTILPRIRRWGPYGERIALNRLSEILATAALDEIRPVLDHEDPEVRALGLRALGSAKRAP